jgi:SAM-dependent methyltransferase
MACQHDFAQTGMPAYERCLSCGTYHSRAAKPPPLLYTADYWSGTGPRSSLEKQVWNVDMHMERGVSKNRFILDRIECERGAALEIGCAPGRLLFWLTWAADFKRVVGIDPSDGKEIRCVGCHDGELFQGFFPDVTRAWAARFDYIAGLDVFEHSFEPEKFLSEAHRLLHRHGQLMLMLPLADDLPDGSQFFNADEHVYLHSRRNMEEMLKDAGFHRLKFDRWTIGHETVSAMRA